MAALMMLNTNLFVFCRCRTNRMSKSYLYYQLASPCLFQYLNQACAQEWIAMLLAHVQKNVNMTWIVLEILNVVPTDVGMFAWNPLQVEKLQDQHNLIIVIKIKIITLDAHYPLTFYTHLICFPAASYFLSLISLIIILYELQKSIYSH